MSEKQSKYNEKEKAPKTKPKKQTQTSNILTEEPQPKPSPEPYEIYTDGSFRLADQNHSNSRGSVGVYHPANPLLNISEPINCSCGLNTVATSLEAEILAIEFALRSLVTNIKHIKSTTCTIFSDNLSAIDRIEIPKSRKKTHLAEARCQELIKQLENEGLIVRLKHVKGHSRNKGNDMAHKLAKAAWSSLDKLCK